MFQHYNFFFFFFFSNVNYLIKIFKILFFISFFTINIRWVSIKKIIKIIKSFVNIFFVLQILKISHKFEARDRKNFLNGFLKVYCETMCICCQACCHSEHIKIPADLTRQSNLLKVIIILYLFKLFIEYNINDNKDTIEHRIHKITKYNEK